MSNGPQPPARSPQRVLKWTILLAVSALIVLLCLQVLLPFANVLAWSSVLTTAFYPMHRRLVRKTGHVSLSAFISSAVVALAILMPVLLLSGLAINQFLSLRDYLQQTFRNGFDLTAIEPLRRASEWITTHLGLGTARILEWLTVHAADLGSVTAGYSLAVAASVSGVVATFIFTIFAMFLLFRDGERVVARIPDLLPFEQAQSEAMLSRIRDVINASVYGVLVIAGLQGGLSALMFWILGVPSAVLWGMVTVVTSVLPLAGAAVVWVPAALYLVAIGRWIAAIVLVVWGALVISSIDNFLRPYLVGGRVGLSELVMFFALLGGLQVFGLLGIIAGPALFAVASSILDVLSEGEPAAHKPDP